MINLLFLMIVLSANLIQFVLSLSVLYFFFNFSVYVNRCLRTFNFFNVQDHFAFTHLFNFLCGVCHLFRSPYLLYMYLICLVVLCLFFFEILLNTFYII